MICNSITKISQINEIQIRDALIKNFGVSFQVHYDYRREENCLVIDYDIKLAKNKKEFFGFIVCSYRFDIEVDEFDFVDGEITDFAVRKCLKANHNNIYNLVENTLRDYGIRYENPYKDIVR